MEQERIEDSELDREPVEFSYGPGGVPWFLLLGYLSFLVFFTWYALEFQLPDYLKQQPLAQQQEE